MKKVLFRVDAAPGIGAGHLMRSIALAQYLVSQGVEIHFLTFQPWDSLKVYLTSQNFQVEYLALTQDELGGEKDLETLLGKLAQGFDWVVLDNYHFGSDYEKRVKAADANLLVIDDEGGRVFSCDIVLNHGLQATQLNYHRGVAQTLLGTDYALIRRELIDAKKNKKKGSSNILVTLGGSGDEEILKKIAEAIQSLGSSEIKVKVLSGFSDSSAPPEFDLSEIYDWADLAICAGGGTSWELCFYGITGIVGILAKNQERVARSLDEKKIFKSIGWFRDISSEELVSQIKSLIHNQRKLAEMRERASQLVDGKGPERIYQAMQEVESESYQSRR